MRDPVVVPDGHHLDQDVGVLESRRCLGSVFVLVQYLPAAHSTEHIGQGLLERENRRTTQRTARAPQELLESRMYRLPREGEKAVEATIAQPLAEAD